MRPNLSTKRFKVQEKEREHQIDGKDSKRTFLLCCLCTLGGNLHHGHPYTHMEQFQDSSRGGKRISRLGRRDKIVFRSFTYPPLWHPCGTERQRACHQVQSGEKGIRLPCNPRESCVNDLGVSALRQEVWEDDRAQRAELSYCTCKQQTQADYPMR